MKNLLINVSDACGDEESGIDRLALVLLLHGTILVFRIALIVAGHVGLVSFFIIFTTACIFFTFLAFVLVFLYMNSLNGVVFVLNFLKS
jgi:hypothetical protein